MVKIRTNASRSEPIIPTLYSIAQQLTIIAAKMEAIDALAAITVAITGIKGKLKSYQKRVRLTSVGIEKLPGVRRQRWNFQSMREEILEAGF
ncbi:hypothetical protein A4A49_57440 [Nicotiana attenuata]|uniref:Uncharacterized protein n=1 Tax=Nicotiana attenuata TaxID=49451 RepID=A0A1J6J8V4_NICAT|nr:hypothetical protein A4A49_57440 [Nicotiana attenuata]